MAKKKKGSSQKLSFEAKEQPIEKQAQEVKVKSIEKPETWQILTEEEAEFFAELLTDFTIKVINHWGNVVLKFDPKPGSNYGKIVSTLSGGLATGGTALGRAFAGAFPLMPAIGSALGVIGAAGSQKLLDMLDPTKDIPRHIMNEALSAPAKKIDLSDQIKIFVKEILKHYGSQIAQLTQNGQIMLASVIAGRSVYYIGQHKKLLNAKTLFEGAQFGFSGRQWLGFKKDFWHGSDFTNSSLETKDHIKSAWSAEGLLSKSLLQTAHTNSLFYRVKLKAVKGDFPKYGIRPASEHEHELIKANPSEYKIYNKGESLLQDLKTIYHYEPLSSKASLELHVDKSFLFEVYAKINRYYMRNNRLGEVISFKDFIYFHSQYPAQKNQNSQEKDRFQTDIKTINSHKERNNVIYTAALERIVNDFNKFMSAQERNKAATYEIIIDEQKCQGFKEMDLSYGDFSHLDLSGINVSYTDLTKANFTGSRITGSDFSRAKMKKARLVNVFASFANFKETILEHANLSAGHFYKTDFERAKLSNVTITGAYLEEAEHLQEADTSFDLTEFVRDKIKRSRKEIFNEKRRQAQNLYDQKEFLHAAQIFSECYRYGRDEVTYSEDRKAELLNYLGLCYYFLKELEMAQINFAEATKMSCKNALFKANAHSYMAMVLSDKADKLRNKKEQALQYDEVFSHLEKAKIFLDEKEKSYALSTGTKMPITTDKELLYTKAMWPYRQARLWYRKARISEEINVKKDFYQFALKAYEEAIPLFENPFLKEYQTMIAHCHNNRGDIQEVLGDLSEDHQEREQWYLQSLESINKAANVHETTEHKDENKEKAIAFLNKGSLYVKLYALSKQKEEEPNLAYLRHGLTALEKATQLDPTYVAAWHYRASALVALGEHAAAKFFLHSALNQTQNDPCLMVDYVETLFYKMLTLVKDNRVQTEEYQSLNKKAFSLLDTAINGIQEELKPSTSYQDPKTRRKERLLYTELVKAKTFKNQDVTSEKNEVETEYPGLKWVMKIKLEEWQELTQQLPKSTGRGGV